MKVYLIAGEPSGDKLGAELMAGLISCAPYELEFCGVGGPLMEEQGLSSLFPINDIAVMGIGEILAKYSFLKERIKNTVNDILKLQPDVLITIDAPEFSLRVAKMVRQKLFVNTIHYVAPTVWAWRPKRAKRMSGYVDHILALFPFEPPYMERAGISCDFVGHPVAEEKLPDRHLVKKFRQEHELNENDKLIAFLPGSRRSEVDRLMPVFRSVSSNLISQRLNIKIVIVAAPAVKNILQENYRTEIDVTQSIGKRYRRQDEIGTPYCITVDFDSLDDNSVTIRSRDSMEQERILITDLPGFFSDL